MNEWMVLFIILGCSAWIAGILKSGFGIGAGAILTPVLSLIMSPGIAVALMTPILLLTDLDGVYNYWKEWNNKIVLRMIPIAIAGTLLGLCLLTFIDSSVLKKVIGLFVLIYATWKIIEGASGRFRLNIPHLNTNMFQYIGAGISGVTGAVANAAGIMLTVVLNYCKLPKRQFMGTLMLLLAIMDTIKLGGFFMLGSLQFEQWQQVLYSLPLVFLGGMFGNLINRKISQFKFEIAINLLIMISGTILIAF